MAEDEHKSLKQIDQELAEEAEHLEHEIQEAEAKHPGLAGPEDLEAKEAPAGGDKSPPA